MAKYKAETIEAYLARGGKITVAPENADKKEERLKSEGTVKVNTQFDYDRMSLGDGEFYFGEIRSKKKPVVRVSDTDFEKLIESADLPQDIIESLKEATQKETNGNE